MLINFFGASVTQQKNGYVDIFDKLLKTHNIDSNVKKYGYGSMHIHDAGVCFINNVIENNPNFCFIDWFSTGFINNTNYIKQYIDTIILKLFSIKCIPIFLLFDRIDIDKARLDMYDYVIEYANEYNINYISIFNNDNKIELLRDDVHTTELGSNYYGTIIYNNFMDKIINLNFNTNKYPLKNMYYDINILDINDTVNNNIILYGNAKVIGIYQKIGLYSGVINIINENNESEQHFIWDQWCHFERHNIKLSFDIKNKLIIKILNDTFDTSSCKHEIEWNKYDKKMEILDIFYIGSIDKYLIDS